jgi:hypothetical protein
MPPLGDRTERAVAPPPVDADRGRYLPFGKKTAADAVGSVSAGVILVAISSRLKLHSFGVAGWQQEGGAGSAFGAGCTEQVGRLGPLIVGTECEPFLAQR